MILTRRAAIGSAAAALSLPVVRTARAAEGVLRIGVGSSLAKLDPMLTTIGDEYIYDNLVFNGLTRMAEDQTVHPDLAEVLGLRRGPQALDLPPPPRGEVP